MISATFWHGQSAFSHSKRASLARVLGAFALLVLALPAMAQSARDTIASRAQVEQAIARGAIVWDVRPPVDYQKGHLPGAVSIGDAASVLRDANREDFISVEAIERILGGAGIDPSHEVVVYGNRGAWNPYFGLYTMQYFGGKSTSVYHDGIEDWVAAGKPVATAESRLPAITLKLTVDAARVASTREVIDKVGKANVQILDVRTVAEFEGNDIRAIRGGHVPGAVNIPYERNWQDPETLAKLGRKQVSSNAGMSLKPMDELRKMYAGLDTEKETIVYCQSGARASESAGVLQQLGFKNVKVYDSSWLGYASTLDAPAENVTFVNVGALHSRIQALQNRLDTLEREAVRK
jgi:thiosulfate/3-mercaptopyruvate sulfurtransferase